MTTLILDEKEYVDKILSEGALHPSRIYLFLGLYARYLYHEKELRKTKIIKALDAFMEENYPRYNPVDWGLNLEKYAGKASRYPLCQCRGIWLAKEELDTISGIHGKVLERLAFTLLCLAKFNNFRNPLNNNWVNSSNGEIYSMACINTTAAEKDLKLGRLREMGLIEHARKIDNLSVQVLFTVPEGTQKLFVSDFRKLGYEWRLYQGENYIRCAGCGILVKNTNGRRRFCKECGEQANKEKSRERMKKIRAEEK